MERLCWHLDRAMLSHRGALYRLVSAIFDTAIQTSFGQESFGEETRQHQKKIAQSLAELDVSWEDVCLCLQTLAKLMQGTLDKADEGCSENIVTVYVNGILMQVAGLRLRLAEEQAISQRDAELLRRHQILRFLSNASHDARAPLTTLLGFTELLQEGTYGDLNERQLSALEHILQASLHLQEILDNLFDLLRLQEKQRALHPRVFNASEVLLEITRMLTPAASRQNIHLQLQTSPNLSWLIADESLVRHIVYQLTLASLRATPKGGRVDVSAWLDSSHLVIEVCDTAPTISPQRLSATLGLSVERTPEQEGDISWDFGLSLAYRYVALHQGALNVFAGDGGNGNRFHVVIPVRTQEAEETPEEGRSR